MKNNYIKSISAVLAMSCIFSLGSCSENGVKQETTTQETSTEINPADTAPETSKADETTTTPNSSTAKMPLNTPEETTVETAVQTTDVTTLQTTDVTTLQTTNEVATATSAEVSETDTSPVTTEKITESVTAEITENTTTVPEETDYTNIEESGTLTLVIDEIKHGKYICSTPWPYPAKYYVACGDETEYCVGDTIEVVYSSMIQTSEWDYTVVAEKIGMSSFELETDVCYKPVIYLYPEEKTEAKVTLDYNGTLTVTYPEYKEGWEVTALPDGTLYDKEGNEYSYLFWEGDSNFTMSIDEGFCVKGKDTVSFLREKLSYLGLTPKEYNDFIVFWLPFMQDNEYNLISFQAETYTDNAKLNVSPAPDTEIRVFMTFTPCDSYIDIPEQKLTPAPDRTGFTVVEWGGSIIH